LLWMSLMIAFTPGSPKVWSADGSTPGAGARCAESPEWSRNLLLEVYFAAKNSVKSHYRFRRRTARFRAW